MSLQVEARPVIMAVRHSGHQLESAHDLLRRLRDGRLPRTDPDLRSLGHLIWRVDAGEPGDLSRPGARVEALRVTPLALMHRLYEWMAQTNDPLLEGPVPAPPSAVVNDPAGVSAREPFVSAVD